MLVRFENYEWYRIILDAWLVCQNNPSKIFRIKCHEFRPGTSHPEYDEDYNIIEDPNYGKDYWNDYWKGRLSNYSLESHSSKVLNKLPCLKISFINLLNHDKELTIDGVPVEEATFPTCDPVGCNPDDIPFTMTKKCRYGIKNVSFNK